MSEEKDVTPVPTKKKSAIVQEHFTEICKQLGQVIHNAELLKHEQKILQEKYAQALQFEKDAEAGA